MGKLKIDVVIVPLSGHLYPTMNLLMPLLKNPRYDIRLFTGQQKRAVAEEAGFKVVTILEGHEMDFERVAIIRSNWAFFLLIVNYQLVLILLILFPINYYRNGK